MKKAGHSDITAGAHISDLAIAYSDLKARELAILIPGQNDLRFSLVWTFTL